MKYLLHLIIHAATLAVSMDHGSLNSTYYISGQLTGTSTFHQSTQLPTSIASSDCSKFMHTTITIPVCTEYHTETETFQFNTSTTLQSVSPNNPYQSEVPAYGGAFTTNDEFASSSAACSIIGISASTTTILVEPTTITMTEIITSDISSTTIKSSTVTSSSTTIAEPSCTADILNDPQNCGKCGNICETGICESGSCTNFQCNVESCGNFNQCGDQSSDCFCFSSTTTPPPPANDNSNMDKMSKKSNGFCGKNAICSGLTACASDLDCVAGSSGNICAISTCCPKFSEDKPGVCLEAQCGNPSQRLRMFSRIRSIKGITAAF